MKKYAMRRSHYEEIKDFVPHGEPYIYMDNFYNVEFVEVDADEQLFIFISKLMGWLA